jgi:hypothetical protein
VVTKATWARLRAIQRNHPESFKTTLIRHIVAPALKFGDPHINLGVHTRDTCGLDGPNVCEFWHPWDTQSTDLPPLADADIAQFHRLYAETPGDIWRNCPDGPAFAKRTWDNSKRNDENGGLQIEVIRPLWGPGEAGRRMGNALHIRIGQARARLNSLFSAALLLPKVNARVVFLIDARSHDK